MTLRNWSSKPKPQIPPCGPFQSSLFPKILRTLHHHVLPHVLTIVEHTASYSHNSRHRHFASLRDPNRFFSPIVRYASYWLTRLAYVSDKISSTALARDESIGVTEHRYKKPSHAVTMAGMT